MVWSFFFKSNLEFPSPKQLVYHIILKKFSKGLFNFLHLVIISRGRRAWPFLLTNLNLFIKGWNLFRCSGEHYHNNKDNDRQRTSFSSGELKGDSGIHRPRNFYLHHYTNTSHLYIPIHPVQLSIESCSLCRSKCFLLKPVIYSRLSVCM